MTRAETEKLLDDFDPRVRREALEKLVSDGPGPGREAAERGATNLHCHSFFSYNALGYSPSRLAWTARNRGWETLGVVDFDVLDGLEETLEAGALAGVRAVVGIETRVFVAERADLVINSPGEPGIFYLAGFGFTRRPREGSAGASVLDRMRSGARARNEEVLALLNRHLPEIALDYREDVLSLTPAGNATERHIIEALDRRACSLFEGRHRALAEFWASRLGLTGPVDSFPAEPAARRNLLRARLIKKGGPAYRPPGKGAFPALEEVVAMIRETGALPTATWLDGTSEGESDPEGWLSFLVERGIAALNIIPDRNWNVADPRERALKGGKLAGIMRAAREIGLPVVAGTEMNSPGQKLVDDFSVPELGPFFFDFRDGALALRGHAVMEGSFGLGMLGPWAAEKLPGRRRRNDFYREIGRAVPAGAGVSFPGAPERPERFPPEDFLALAGGRGRVQ